MTPTNLFKMEFYKNFRDRAWIVITGVLSLLALLTTILGILAMKSSGTNEGLAVIMLMMTFGTLAVFVLLGFLAYSIIYPFHLLSTDYSNNVLGLTVASGVKRQNYYFVKLAATILTYLMALVAIFLIPFILLAGVFQAEFFNTLASIIKGFGAGNFWFATVNFLIGQLAAVVLTFFVVIFTRGKFWGIFVFLGISAGISLVTRLLGVSIGLAGASGALSYEIIGASSWFSLIIAIAEILIFGLTGLSKIKRQDL